ncbi:hypothetical protein PFICI_04002 [Pestalotiopsis fici W106-1]|uniref:Xaa-Pro dipeptidyl-peptidase C-terminal domain-containing protein n=1 Tax=Pestalotiopsis fici (strain W106-1 / CGMCC3.15140) TaxID=1229662 RepID=W3XKI2_PESFW|nr:uncharacterized protein PFICI_04002 [Pestalotiopsis fici W106-1]ETS85977.1 hypothetical protein PFICI_04002 [Pestalotiopsis fici W106-1]
MPQLNFNEAFIEIQAGNHFIDDTLIMSLAEPNNTLYWQDKTVRLENIEIPAYVVASYENVLHTHGTFEGFRKIQSENKWLRVHNSHEWYDLYQNDSQSELLQYFDYYLKGIDNGWEETPQIRVSLLDPNGTDVVNRVIEEWPPSDYTFSQLYLHPNNTMSPDQGAIAANVSYAAVNGSAIFQIPVEEESELLGYMKLRLWVEAVGSDDMDLYITVTKVSANGDALLRTLPQGGTSISAAYQYSHVSRRQLDTDKSTESEPVLLFQGEQMLSAGEIVPVDIGLWPLGLRIHAGEMLQVTVEPGVDSIGGPAFGSAEIPVPRESFTFMPADNITFVTLGDPTLWAPDWVTEQAPSQTSRNIGTHVIHMGGQYDSHLLVPLKTVRHV